MLWYLGELKNLIKLCWFWYFNDVGAVLNWFWMMLCGLRENLFIVVICENGENV